MNSYSEVLTPLVEKIKKFRDLYTKNEMAVRDQIINPILRHLGWNPENPEEVQPNLFTEGGVPDYALLKDGKKILFIEAKNLSVDIRQKKVLQQLANYSLNEGAKYGVLTNGVVWILLKTFEEGTTLKERIIWEADLEKEELPNVYRKILTLSKTNIENVEVLVKKAQILDEIWQSLLNEPKEIIKGLMPMVKSIISQGYKDYQFEDGEIESLLEEKIKEIIPGQSEKEALPEVPVESVSRKEGTSRKMKLGDKVFELRYSYEILVNTANWLIKVGKIKPSDCPVQIVRGKRYLINNQPKHESGSDFHAPKQLSNGLWIETNYSTNECINQAKSLLKKFGVTLELEIE